jgi:hypothetical protein
MTVRRIADVLVIIFIMTMAMGCGGLSAGKTDRIAVPQNSDIPLQGKWVIDRCLFENLVSNAKNLDNRWLGTSAEFSENAAALGQDLWEDIHYKVKQVNAEEYFLFRYKKSAREVGVTDKNIYVITLSSNDKFLYEFVRIKEDEVIANIDDSLYCLRKVSSDVDLSAYKAVKTQQENAVRNTGTQDSVLRSGLLLGIRTPVKTLQSANQEDMEACSYKTLWIAAVDRKLEPVLEADDIFLPRMSGFWKVELKKASEKKRTEDILLAYSISDINSRYQFVDSLNPEFWNEREGVLHKKILYVGNDYISVENTGKGTLKSNPKETWQEDSLQTLPVDKISNPEGIKISDIAGENGTLAMESGLTSLLASSNAKDSKEIPTRNLEENFALFRKTGHWFFMGRVMLPQNEQVPFLDFNINLLPPAELVMYDELHLSWTQIKDRIPDAVDAYTSPNWDLAVILTRNQLLVFTMTDGTLGDTPVRKLQLQEGDTVVMAEWALGDYMEIWEKTFIKNNAAREVGE